MKRKKRNKTELTIRSERWSANWTFTSVTEMTLALISPRLSEIKFLKTMIKPVLKYW